MYVIVWEYIVQPENKEQFEFEYGSKGSWASLFGQWEDYRGSVLLKSKGEEYAYLLIDHWTDAETYEAFKRRDDKYTLLSKQLEHLSEKEEKIGSYTTV